MKEYRAKNGLLLHTADTGQGWSIKSGADLLLALEGRPELATVATGYILEALAQSLEDRTDYEDVRELAAFLAVNYL